MAPFTTENLEYVEEFEVFIQKSSSAGLDKESKVLVNSLFAIDKNLRLQLCLGSINDRQKESVKKALLTVFELD